MQSAASIDRFRPPIAIRALNKFGAMFNGKVSRRLTPEDLIETAKRRTGLHDFGDGDFREPLARLLESCWRDARLNVIGNIALRSDVLRILRNRLFLQRDLRLHSGIAQHEIRRPLFVLGLPRTGTTFLHTLLSADPENRAPLTWEVMEPSPPTNAEKEQRIRRASQNLACLEWMAPNFRQLHPVGAHLPQECVSLMSPTFLSDQFDTMYNVPGYREWFLQQDLQPAYAFHRRFLQHLQERKNRRRWVLKAPTHMFALPTLLSSYPDALFVQTHRSPIEAITSVSSLITILRRVFSDAVDPMKIGEEALHYWSNALNKFLPQRDRLPADRILDISYLELRRDPVGTVRCVYEYFGWPFSASAENPMRDVLARQPRDLHGFHHYKPAQFGLRGEHEQKFFSNYCERFSLGSAVARHSIKPVSASAPDQPRLVQDRVG
ncbi:MAG TPA: sulfotransferase [Chthoniobacterales bacterium]|nr:sulfotransferase [Chthoniobacterales bacterium]